MPDESHIVELDLDQLLLDPENPRLPKSAKRDEASIIDYLAREAAIDDLIESIARSGYFSSEPLIVYPVNPKAKPTKASKYYVAEGNRRVTALKLLHNPSLYPRRKKIAQIADSAEHKPTKIPAIVYQKRTDTLALLGYRHITGIKQWEPLAKARYIAELLKKFGKGKDTDRDYAVVAEMVGSKPHYVSRTLDALATYELIEDNGFFEIEDLNEGTLEFSILLTAVAYKAIHEYLAGVSEEDEKANFYENRDALNVSRVKRLAQWLFEKDSAGNTPIEESRNIKKLNEIVEHKRALARFEGGASIDIAYRLTTGAEQDFAQSLNAAEAALTDAAALVAVVQIKEPYSDQIQNIIKQARHIAKSLRDED